MSTYRLYGMTVTCDLPLPELPAAQGPAAMAIRRGAVGDPAGSWFDIWPHSDGRSWVRACRTPDGYQIRHGDRAAFALDRPRREISYDAPGCETALLRHFLVDQVVPLMLSLDSLVLHASSVEVHGGIVAFVGPGGAGKSTLALALARAGFPMVSDDGLLLRREAGNVAVTPAYAGVRLWKDSASALGADDSAVDGAAAHKCCYRETTAFTGVTDTLKRIYVVDPRHAPAVAVDRLAGPDAAIEIVRQTYRLALDDRRALSSQLDDIVALTRAVPVWRLSFPRVLEEWQRLAAQVAAAIRGHAGGRA